jgi:hypothetical protein
LGSFSDIGFFGDIGAEIKFFVQKLENAWAFGMTSEFEKFFNFIRSLTTVSNAVKYQNV